MRQGEICRHTGKFCHVSVAAATVNARLLAHDLQAQRRIMQKLYVYSCGRCDRFHLTRDRVHGRTQNQLVYEPASPEMQRWSWRW